MSIEGFKQKNGYEIDGMLLPRVTAITSVVSKYPLFLKERGYFNEAAKWGHFVHKMFGNLARHERFEETETTMKLSQTFHDWIFENDILLQNPKEDIEKRVVHTELAYAGTLDLVAHVKGRISIIDFKTGTQMSPEYLLQTAGYMAAYNETAKVPSETRWILRVDHYQECIGCLAQKRERGARVFVREGKSTCNHQWSSLKTTGEFIELTEYEQDFRAFIAAKELWEWHHKTMLRAISNYPKAI